MSLEAATFISDLDSTNPGATDVRSQGDDHLRLIKAALKATFPSASKAFYLPSSATKSADFSVASTEMNRTFVIDTTGGAVAATLPSLAAGDAGWECSFIKSNTGTNPYFILPSSGTIQSGEASGLAKTRRCVPGHKTKVLWTGTAWIAERVIRLPIGAIVDCPLASLPVGYEWAAGQTLASASTNYPDFYLVNGNSGVIQDRKGRVAPGRDDMGGAAASRLTNAGSGIDGTALGAAGGAQSATIAQGNLPNVTLATTIAAGQGSHTHPQKSTTVLGETGSDISAAQGAVQKIGGTTAAATLPSMTGTTPLGGSGTALAIVQPAIVTNMIVVVE